MQLSWENHDQPVDGADPLFDGPVTGKSIAVTLFLICCLCVCPSLAVVVGEYDGFCCCLSTCLFAAILLNLLILGDPCTVSSSPQ